MCGIIGYIGVERAIPILLNGLQRLEYRGYDSAGIAVLDGGRILRFRRAGKVRDLVEDLNDNIPVGRHTARRPKRTPTPTSTVPGGSP